MNQPELQNTNVTQIKNDESGDIKKIVFKILNNWYWFILSVFVTGVLAFAYNRYTIPVYEINTTMLFEDDYGNSSSMLGGTGAVGDVFQGLGGLNSMKNINNQILILNSTPVVAKTIEELNFEVSYYAVGNVAVRDP